MNARQRKALAERLVKHRLTRAVAREMGVKFPTLQYWLSKGFPAWRENDAERFNEIATRLLAGKAKVNAPKGARPSSGDRASA